MRRHLRELPCGTTGRSFHGRSDGTPHCTRHHLADYSLALPLLVGGRRRAVHPLHHLQQGAGLFAQAVVQRWCSLVLIHALWRGCINRRIPRGCCITRRTRTPAAEPQGARSAGGSRTISSAARVQAHRDGKSTGHFSYPSRAPSHVDCSL